ncbi:TerD family protein [Paenibacillus sp. CN-4]|uniref:TerD family protein n=1 Tax=Paenibacillus nanchangensis TaxID=3348343 RepID=UPI00397A0EB4
MGIEAVKGQKADLTKTHPGLGKITVEIGWNAPPAMELDTSAFVLGASGKTARDEDLIFYNNPSSEFIKYIELTASYYQKAFEINLHRIPPHADKIAFTLTIHEGEERRHNFGQAGKVYFRIFDRATNGEILRCDLDNQFSIETAIVLGELYRYNGEWKFHVVGAGFSGGLERMCRHYGLEVGGDPEPVTPPASFTPPVPPAPPAPASYGGAPEFPAPQSAPASPPPRAARERPPEPAPGPPSTASADYGAPSRRVYTPEPTRQAESKWRPAESYRPDVREPRPEGRQRPESKWKIPEAYPAYERPERRGGTPQGPAWGQPSAPPQSSAWGQPPAPPQSPAWGQPPAPPQSPAWGQPPAPPQSPAWGQPSAPPQGSAWGQPQAASRFAGGPPVPPPAPPAGREPDGGFIRPARMELRRGDALELQVSDGPGGEIRIGLDYDRNAGGGLFGRSRKLEIELGCLYELRDGSKSVVQAIGSAFGNYASPPYIQLERSGRNGGEELRINGGQAARVRRVLVFAYIYEGATQWSSAGAVLTLRAGDGSEAAIRLDTHDDRKGMCAVAMLSSTSPETFRVERLVQYYAGHREMDQAYQWGLRWVADR